MISTRRGVRPAIILVIGMLALPCLGDIIVVDDDGSTPDLQAALDSAAPGDTVLVLPGIYHGNFIVPEQVSLVGSGPELTILDGGGLGTTLGLFKDASVSGFTIRGGTRGVEGVTGNQVTGNIIRDNSGESNGGGGLFIGCGLVVASNLIVDNSATVAGGGLWILDFPSAACAPGALPPSITNNVISGNSASNGSAMFVETGDEQDWPEITHNTIVGNLASPGGGALHFHSSGFVYYLSVPSGRVTNNVISGNPGGGVVNYIYSGDSYYTYGPDISDNTFFGNGAPELGSPRTSLGTDGNVLADPLLTDASGGDFRLLPDSPAIDAATVLPSPPSTDLMGFPRPLDGDLDGTAVADVGALEETGEIADVAFAADKQTLSWSPRAGTLGTHLYRGDVLVLLAGGDYAQDPGTVPAAQQWCDLTGTSFTDTESPAVGGAFFYLATAVDLAEGVLGFKSSREVRPNAHPCGS